MKFCQSYLFNATSDRIIIKLDKERNGNECFHHHCSPRRSRTRQKQLCDYFVSNRCSFADDVAHNLESFGVPLTMILKIHKNNRNNTDTCLEGWGVGGTHFTGSYIGIWGYDMIGICVRGYTYHSDTVSVT